jgi:hypothetical protein
MTKSKEELIFIGIDNERVELLGADKEAFLLDQAQIKAERVLLEAEYKAKQDSRESAIKKLAEIAGLTEKEIEAII